MLGRRLIPLLEVQICVTVPESVLAGKDAIPPRHPGHAQGAATEQLSREIGIKLALGGPAEHAGLSLLIPSSRVKIEQDRKKAFDLRFAIALAERHIRTAFVAPQDGADFRTEP